MQIPLLPNGLTDLMPDIAEAEAEATHHLIMFFKEKGYRRVKPPLIEFVDMMLSGPGHATEEHLFRMMDPVSEKMMGLRADITPQIARIAATRFPRSDYPLRLSYAGDVLRVKGTHLDPTRQFSQVGCELIGQDTPESDIESMFLALAGLKEIGLKNLTLDLSLPALIRDILEEDLTPELQQALNNKNKEQIASYGAQHAEMLLKLITLSGGFEDNLKELKEFDAPDIERLRLVIEGLQEKLAQEKMEGISLTLDPARTSTLDYHRGIAYALYTKGVRSEIARGGRYDFETASGSETAIGFSIYMNNLRGKI